LTFNDFYVLMQYKHMPRFFLKFFIFIAVVLSLVPLCVAAETVPDAADYEISQLKTQILQLQIEILRLQIALLTGNAQTSPAASVSEKDNCAQLEISWDSVRGATGYRLYRNGSMVYEGTARSFIDSGLTLGEKYKYIVHGLYRGEQGEPSEVQEMTAPDVCPPATPDLSFKAKPCGGQITISWSSDSRATVCQLFRGTKEIYSGPLTRFIDSSLTPSKSYEYKIRAGNKGGWSDFSAVSSFQSSSVCAPEVPEVSYVVPESSQEGTLLIEMKSSPANNVRVWPGYANQSAMAFKLEAQYSDITVVKIDLFFDGKAWLYLDKVKLQYNGRYIAEEEISRESFVRVGDVYRLRFENIQSVVKEDSSGTIMVRVEAKEEQPGDTPHYLSVFLENNSIRGIDQAGIWQYAPISGGGQGGDFVRTFRIE
jgi:hypothetical protein